jgi:hypothetical protein
VSAFRSSLITRKDFLSQPGTSKMWNIALVDEMLRKLPHKERYKWAGFKNVNRCYVL